MLLALALSLLTHLLVGVGLRLAAPIALDEHDDDPLLLVDIDIDEAPEAPEAEMPVAEEAPPPPLPPAPVEEPPAAEPEPIPEPEAVIAEEGLGLADAGVPESDAGGWDAGADAGGWDAGADAGADAGGWDAGADAGGWDAGATDAGGWDAGPDRDAGAPSDAGADAAVLLARLDDAGAGPASAVGDVEDAVGAGVEVAENATGDAGVIGSDGVASAAGTSGGDGTATTGAAAGSGVTGTPSSSDVNMLAYAPAGDVLSVLLRFDRLRGTPWAAPTEAILAPMPDYRALVGSREVSVAEQFELLIIATPRPRDVTATTLAGRYRHSSAEIRAFIDHPEAPVSWYPARGGAAGRRMRSRLVPPSDVRVFSMPMPEWVVLTQPTHLGDLLMPRPGELDRVPALADVARPAWLAALPEVEARTGTDEGPALMVTAQGLLPPRWQAPYVGELDTPERATLALEITSGGFFVRGVLLFSDEAKAEAFVATVDKARTQLTATRLGRALLAQFQLENAVAGLSFKRNRAKVAYATSISVADARTLLERVAARTEAFFARQRGPRPVQRAPTPVAPVPEPSPGSPGDDSDGDGARATDEAAPE
ncbi:hypothetical protein [Haliangium sp.]|uniref:hypothetical protein n=1 Tax=Haliangium sp. TaxID=2663208 RepID=UPI003D0DDDAF